MFDLVDGLRSDENWIKRLGVAEGSVAQTNICARILKAADEIERLRALIANAPCPGDTIQIKECVARGKCGCDLGAALTNG